MKTLTISESRDWCKARGIDVDERGKPQLVVKELHVRRIEVPKAQASRLLWMSKCIEFALRPWTRSLLWVTTKGIWPSSENWHLYYRLRQSYGDHQLIDDAPGHLFQDYESPDLISFIQLGLCAGWDMSLLTEDDYARAFVSHDEWIEFAMQDDADLEKLAKDLIGEG
ncbi:MAG: hypothetical protein WAW96_04675 [Alphaproteobacteria bacterium]